MATRLTAKELMDYYMRREAESTPPGPPPSLAPWYYQDEFIGPPSPPKPPQSQGLIEKSADSYQRRMAEAVAAYGRQGSPQNAVSQLQRAVPTDILTWALDDGGTSDMINPIAGLGAKAAKVGTSAVAKAAKGAPLDKVGKMKAAWYDSMEGLKGFDNELYEGARRYAGTAKKAELDIKGFEQALSPIKARGFKENVEDMLNVFRGKPTRFDRAGQYAMLDRMEEAAGLVDGPVAGVSSDEIKAMKIALEESFQPDELKRIKQARDAVTAKFNAQLDEAVEVGMVSRQSAEAAKEKGLKYVPLHALAADATEELGGAAMYGGHSANPNIDWFRRMQSSAEKVDLQNPFDEALVTHTTAARRNIEKNKVMNILTSLPEKDEQFKGLVIPLETAELRQGRIDLAKSIQENQRRIAELSGELNLEQRVADSLYTKFTGVQKEMSTLAGELANKNLNWKPNPEVREILQKIQRKQAKVLGAARKMKDHAEGSGMYGLRMSLADAEKEIALAKRKLWGMRAEKLPDGFKEVKRFKNGLQERWAVPEVVADTLMHMNQQQVDMVTKVAAMSSKSLRFGATAGNMVFLPVNAIRDFGTTAIRSENGLNPLNMVPRWIGGLFSAIGEDAAYKSFIKNGGGYATFAEVLNTRPSTLAGSTGWGSRFAKTVTTPSELFKALTVDSPPMRALTYANEKIELAPRLAEYKAALRSGKTAEQAAFAGRDITVDFMKAGDSMRVANMWVPFLNANLQGSANTIKTLRNGGASTYLKVGGLVGLPAATTYVWNTTNFPEVWDDISQHDKDNYHIIILNDSKDEETEQFYTGVIKLPKNQFSKLIANPIEEALDYTRKNEPVAYGRIAAKMFNTLSPVGGFDDKGTPSLSDVWSQVLPPFMKAPLEYGFNKNFYTGRDIVPERMQDWSPERQFYPGETPKSAQAVGEALGMSPLKIEQGVRTLFGGLGGQVMEPGRLGKDFERRFGRAYGGEMDRAQIENIKKLEREEGDETSRFEEMVHEWKDRDPKEVKKAIAERAAKNPAAFVRWAEARSDRKNLSPLENYLKRGGASASVKEAWARGYLDTIPEAERTKAIERWREKKVLSGAILDKLAKP